MLGLAACSGESDTAAELASNLATAEADSAFTPMDFEPPFLVETDNFKLVPLGPDLVDLDFAA